MLDILQPFCAPCYCSYWLIGRRCNYCRRYDITIWPGETCNTWRWRWLLSLLTMWQNHCWRDVSAVWGHECAPSYEIYLVDLEHLNQICKKTNLCSNKMRAKSFFLLCKATCSRVPCPGTLCLLTCKKKWIRWYFEIFFVPPNLMASSEAPQQTCSCVPQHFLCKHDDIHLQRTKLT